MLSAMRRHAYSWAIRAILTLITVVFIFWGLGSSLFQQIRPVATVDGQKILADEIDREVELLKRNLQQLYGPGAAQLIKGMNLREEALQQIVESRLVQSQARRLGLAISDRDLTEAIASNRAFHSDGRFDLQAYQAVLRANDYEPAQYEATTRTAMLGDALRHMIEQGVQLSDSEARQEFDLLNEQLSLAYLEVPYRSFIAAIHPSEPEIAAFDKQYAEQFREPERVKALFIHYAPAVLAAKFQPTEQEIRQYYERFRNSRFTHREQVHARHILLSVSENAGAKTKAQVRAQAEQLLARLRKGADFAKLARQDSDDDGNKFKGGDLGFFSRGQMVKPFEEAAFKLKPGELAIAETRFGYHVIRVDEIKPAHVDTLQEARAAIIEALREQQGDRQAHDAVREDLAAALGGASLNALAAKRGLQALQTPLFAQNEPVKGAEDNRDFNRQVFKLDKGEVRAITGQGQDPYLVHLLDRRASYLPPLKEIHDRVRDGLVRSRAEAAARVTAEKLLEQIKRPGELATVAAANKLQVRQTGQFNRARRAVPDIGDFPEATEAASAVPELPGLIERVMEHAGNSYIFEVLSRTAPEDGQWRHEQASFKEQMLRARRARAWTAYVDTLKQQARITVDAKQLGEAAGGASP